MCASLHTSLILYVAQGLHPNKRKIETKYKLPLLNWVTIPATQIAGTVFHQLDDESVLRQLDFMDFEETFKTKAQAGIKSKIALCIVNWLLVYLWSVYLHSQSERGYNEEARASSKKKATKREFTRI